MNTNPLKQILFKPKFDVNDPTIKKKMNLIRYWDKNPNKYHNILNTERELLLDKDLNYMKKSWVEDEKKLMKNYNFKYDNNCNIRHDGILSKYGRTPFHFKKWSASTLHDCEIPTNGGRKTRKNKSIKYRAKNK